MLTREQQIEVYDRIYRLISHYRSCKDAARALGIHSNAIHSWLSCSTLPWASGLICLRNNFLTSVDYILLLSDDPTCPPDRPGAEIPQIQSLRSLPESHKKIVSARIRTLAECAGGVLSFSEAIGSEYPVVRSWIIRNCCPNSLSIIKICRVSHVSADWLLGLTDEGGPGWVRQD